MAGHSVTANTVMLVLLFGGRIILGFRIKIFLTLRTGSGSNHVPYPPSQEVEVIILVMGKPSELEGSAVSSVICQRRGGFKTDIGLIRFLCKRSVTLSYALMISTIHHLIIDVYKKRRCSTKSTDSNMEADRQNQKPLLKFNCQRLVVI
ncbi:MAG: hypothetical protein SRB2_03038 [Desulfobacteraceae bacterium Eth-SRB2]|nr:MAG: hypothetical protein SRB2_03038 [Desulfobacteraceae bacterium Eth-SRB2]